MFYPAAQVLQRSSPAAPPPAALTLVDAVVARIESSLVAGGVLTWFGTGFEVEPEMPFGRLEEPDESDTYWTTEGDGQGDGHLVIHCYAGTKGQAESLGLALFAQLQDAPLAFRSGILTYLRQSGRSCHQDPDPFPGGGDCWDETRQFHFMIAF